MHLGASLNCAPVAEWWPVYDLHRGELRYRPLSHAESTAHVCTQLNAISLGEIVITALLKYGYHRVKRSKGYN